MAIAAAPRESERAYSRIRVGGKFLVDGGAKTYLRGVTYGTFGPGPGGEPLPGPEVVERDFARMAANGVNALRLYTVPPRWLLDAASNAETPTLGRDRSLFEELFGNIGAMGQSGRGGQTADNPQ